MSDKNRPERGVVYPESAHAAAVAFDLDCTLKPLRLYKRIVGSPEALEEWEWYFDFIDDRGDISPSAALAIACYYMSGGRVFPSSTTGSLTRALKNSFEMADLFRGVHNNECDVWAKAMTGMRWLESKSTVADCPYTIPTIRLCLIFANLFEKCI